MTAFVIRRVWQGAISLLAMSLIVFLLSRMLGNPLDLLLPEWATPEERAAVAVSLGLDRSLPVQYWAFLSNAVQGDLGQSIRFRQPVMDLFLDRIPVSLMLVLPSFVLAIVVGVPFGVISATTKSGLVRRFTEFWGVAGLAAPNFWVGIVLIFTFSVGLGWFPAGRPGGFSHMVLPVFTLGTFLMAGIMRLTRSSIRGVMSSEYIKLARLQGFSEFRVIWVYALRNSLIPTMAFIGVYFSILVSGTVVIEQVFAWPGVGRLLLGAVNARDYPVMQGVILLSAGMVIVINALMDIAQAVADPKARL